MTHWYREPKRVNLMELLERAGIEFVLSRDEFSENDLLNLREALPQKKLSERLALGIATSGDYKKVLIIAPTKHPDPSWLSNPEPWAGIFILPANRPYRWHVLHALFTINRSFHNGARGQRAISKGILRRFVLDMRLHPPSLYGVRGTQPDLTHGQ